MRKKYEEMYNKFKNGESDKKLEELKNKIQNKVATQDEYKEVRRIEKVKGNITKVENIIKLQENLKEEANKIEKQIYQIEQDSKLVKELDKKVKETEKELEQLEKERDLVSAKLKSASTEEKKDLTIKLKDINSKIDNNNEKYQKSLQEKLTIQNREKNDKYAKMSIGELKKQYNNLKNKESKCNLAIINLLKGRDWDDIEQNMDKYQNRDFTKKKQVKENKNTKKELTNEEIKEIENNLQKESEEVLKEAKQKVNNEEEKATETSLKEVSKFAQKHPRLAKIGNWLKNIVSKKTANNDTKATTDTKKEETIQNNKYEEKVMKAIINSNENDFKKQLRDISEKGYEEYAKNRANEKMKQAKQQAYDREKAKYGEKYAKRSYNPEEKDER